MQRERRSLRRRSSIRSYLLVIALGLVVGLLLTPIAWGVATDQPTTKSTVAVVPIQGGITGGTAEATVEQLRRAQTDSSVEAVVLVSNSPGGSAAASERLYLAVDALANETPVVASVDASATSGAYYAIAPSDQIYVKPSSIVGSIGVLARLGADLDPNDAVATTGPDKLGESEREFRYTLASLQRAFVGAVFQQRGERIDLSRSDVSTAGIYTGGEAVETGMADGIGGRQTAIRAAADRADLTDYRVQVFAPQRRALFLSRNTYLASTAENKTLVEPTFFTGRTATEGPVFLMLPAHALADDRDQANTTTVEGSRIDPSGSDGGMQPATAAPSPEVIHDAP